MENLTVAEPLLRVFQQTFNVPVVTLNDSPATLADWDSIGHLALLDAMRASFSVEFTSEEINAMETVGAIVNILKRKHCL
ncbi:MAG: acyl carrier protein [Planctomycetota bacterium]